MRNLIRKITERYALIKGIPVSKAENIVKNSLIAAFALISISIFIIFNIHLVSGIIILLLGFAILSPILTAFTGFGEEEDWAFLIATAYSSKLGPGEIIRRLCHNYERLLPRVVSILKQYALQESLLKPNIKFPLERFEKLLTIVSTYGPGSTSIHLLLSDFVSSIRARLESFREFMRSMGELTLSLFVAISTILLTLGIIFGGGNQVIYLTVITSVLTAVMTMFLMLTRLPKHYPRIAPYIPSICAFIGGLLSTYILYNFTIPYVPWYVLIALAIFVSSVIAYALRFKEAWLVEKLLNTLPIIAMSVYEHLRQVKTATLRDALLETCKKIHSSIRKLFNPILHHNPIDIAEIYRNYPPFAITIRALLDFSEVGVSEESYRVLAEGLQEIVKSYRNIRAMLSIMIIFMAIINPAIFGFLVPMVLTMNQFLGPVSQMLKETAAYIPLGSIFTIEPINENTLILSGLLISLFSGFCGGFLRGKIIDAILHAGIAVLVYALFTYVCYDLGLVSHIIGI